MFYITKNLKNDEIIFDVTLNGKFYNDEVYYDDNDKTIIMEGVIFNLTYLLEENKVNNIRELIELLYKQKGDIFYDIFRGNFRGCYYDKKREKLIVFTDHCGNKPVFYHKSNEFIIFSTSVKSIVEKIKHSKEIELNVIGAYMLLTAACMYDDQTIFQDVFKLVAGYYFLIEENICHINQYFNWSKIEKIEISEDDAINEIDRLFLDAVHLQANKNKEYGFDNYASLSAGMDSRMVSYALKRLKIDNVINYTYSQSGELDNIIPMKMASELGNIWIYKQLDNGKDLLDIDEAIEVSDSLIYYLWPAQLNGFLKLLNTDNLGVIHTGVLGDQVIASAYGTTEEGKKYQVGDCYQSQKLICRLEGKVNTSKYENSEIGAIYNRGFNGVCLGYSTSFQKYTEASSPFMNLELFKFCMSLPTKMKLGYNIYYKWAKRFYGESTKYLHNGKKVKAANMYIHRNGTAIPVNGIFRRIIKKIRCKLKLEIGMNPIDIWYESNEDIKNTLNEFYNNNINLLDKYPELKQDAIYLFNSVSVMDKLLVISLLGILKHFI